MAPEPPPTPLYPQFDRSGGRDDPAAATQRRAGQAEPKQHHRPGRWFGNGSVDGIGQRPVEGPAPASGVAERIDFAASAQDRQIAVRDEHAAIIEIGVANAGGRLVVDRPRDVKAVGGVRRQREIGDVEFDEAAGLGVLGTDPDDVAEAAEQRPVRRRGEAARDRAGLVIDLIVRGAEDVGPDRRQDERVSRRPYIEHHPIVLVAAVKRRDERRCCRRARPCDGEADADEFR